MQLGDIVRADLVYGHDVGTCGVDEGCTFGDGVTAGIAFGYTAVAEVELECVEGGRGRAARAVAGGGCAERWGGGCED